ncbi:MAG TPA: TonB-dependent receptor [Patescibacteria group bacterium]|nr:TonB-dependent receptor [Patescibacteria group bacterium]
MQRRMGLLAAAPLMLIPLFPAAVFADQAAKSATSATSAVDPNAERVEITATRIPEDVDTVAGSLTIVTGEDLRGRGAVDLRSALGLAAGIDIAPGGDAGPFASVPELWGLKEFDAFLLVVDGVPWGGAFVPALASVDLTDVERIEIQRGPAPVMYGATSFVGVIHVIHNPPGLGGPVVEASGGSYGTGAVVGRAPLPAWGSMGSSVSGGVEHLGFREDRTEAGRGRLTWRASLPAGAEGTLRLLVGGTWINQDPGSPHPRVGTTLSPDVPVGANHNPSGSHLDESRLQVSGVFDRKMRSALWSSTLSVTRSSQDALRGFLTDVTNVAPNANGFRQDTDITDLYFDSHLAFSSSTRWKAVVGLDHLSGHGFAHGGDFDYFVNLDGRNPPDEAGLPSQSDVRIRDEREFSGLYGQVEWLPTDRWRIEVGGRLNRTAERRTVRSNEFAAPPATESSDSTTVLRGTGSVGLTWTARRAGADGTWLYAAGSLTYKPAAIDFGIDSEAEILAPETANSYQAGLKNRLADGRLEVEAAFFQMDFENLVVTQSVMGLPALVNGGRQRFRGAEVDADWRIHKDLRWRTSYSLHDARFRDFVTDFGGVATQLAGNRLEMSARNMASTGLLWAPEHGWRASAQANYVGSRFLNKRNTALAPAYTTWSAGAGYRRDAWEIRLDGYNLNNRRPPVSESELGDAQYYRLPARRLILSAVLRLK